jgi:excisionase family DNA binding protein
MGVTQAAKLIGISPSKLYQLVSARQISHYRIGGKIVFDEGDIATFRSKCHIPVMQEISLSPTPRPHLRHLNLPNHPTAR